MTDGPQRTQSHRKPRHSGSPAINSAPSPREVNRDAPGSVSPQPLLSRTYSRGLFDALGEKANKSSPSSDLRLFSVSRLAWMTTTAWSRCATGVTKGRCGGDRPGPPASSCPPPRTSGGAFPCGSSTAPLFSAIPVSVSGLSFRYSRAGWVVGFRYVRVCQQNMVT